MERGSSNLVREIAMERYIQPALSSGKRRFSIAVKDLMKDLRPEGFPSANYSQICSSIRERNFVKSNGIRVVGWDGPPSGQSSTIVIHYEALGTAIVPHVRASLPASEDVMPQSSENRTANALRLMEGLRGLLKGELAEYGGGEAFLRWVRSEDDEQADSIAGAASAGRPRQ